MSLDFTNAISDRVENNTESTLDNIEVGSWLAWIRRTADSTDRFVWCKGRTDLSRAKYVKINSSDNGQGAGSIQMGIYRATTPYIVEPTSTGIALGAWSCIAGVWDTSLGDSDQHIYIGDLDTDLTEPGAYTVRTVGSGLVADDSADILTEGNHPVANNLSLAGWMEYLLIWSGVNLTLDELVEQQFHLTVTTGCVLFHRFITSPTVVDDSGNNNFGTVTGATLAPSFSHQPRGPWLKA